MPDPLPGFDVPPLSAAFVEPVWQARELISGLAAPSVSVVISTLDRAAYLEATLHSLTYQRYRHFEIVVVQGPCSDETREVLDRWSIHIERAWCDEKNLARSRNIGIRAARGDVIAFIDDDAIPEPDWLERLVAPFEDASVGATGGAIRNWTGVKFQCKALQVSIGAVVRKTTPEALASGVLCPAFTGTNFCVRRDLLTAAGLFDEAYAYYLEESDLQQILFQGGLRLAYVEHAEVHHLRAPNAYRDIDRVPSDYRAKMSSIAYYCLKHRLEDDTRDDVLRRLSWQIYFAVMEMRRMFQQERLGAGAIAPLLRSAFSGLRRGTDVYRSRAISTGEPAGLPQFFARDLPLDKLAGFRLRIAVVCRGREQASGAAAAHDLARALAGHGREVTLVEDGERRRVEFRAGYWVHQRPKLVNDPRPHRGLTMGLALRELKRVEVNRAFDVLIDLDFGSALVHAAVYPWRPFRVGASRLALVRAEKAQRLVAAPSSLVSLSGGLLAECDVKCERAIALGSMPAAALPRP